jgi:dephospho-CoA kinase
MLIFGITGGSGAGKSTASDIFRQMGIKVIDADKTARQVVEKGEPCLEELKTKFGAEVIANDGSLDRKKLGNIVFSDENKLKSLNEITHKYIRRSIISELEKSGAEFAAIDGAVIIGSSVEDLCAFIVSVLADREIRLKRIISRDNLSREQAENRLNSQPSDEFYMENSSYVIYNNGNENELKLQVKEVCEKIKENEV